MRQQEANQAHLNFLQTTSKENLIAAIAHSMRAIEIVGNPTAFTSLCHEFYIKEYQRALFDRFGVHSVRADRVVN